jgi:hypothetical protein
VGGEKTFLIANNIIDRNTFLHFTGMHQNNPQSAKLGLQSVARDQ